MDMNDEQMAEGIFAAAAALAEKMGMVREEDMFNLKEGQSAIMVTATGIVTGKVRVASIEQRTARIESFLLNDTILSEYKFSETVLCKNRFGADGNGGWFKEPDIACSLPMDAVLYIR